MKKVWDWIKNNPNRSMFLLPILLVAAISISHVVSWYDMANPINWAIYLSIAIEVAAITALVAATNRIKGGIWFMFGIVTFIQMIGNIFYSFKEIDETGELFKSWIELTGPVWELMGTETTDLVGMKRWLAFLEGGLLPIISLTSLHFFVRYEKNEDIGLTNNEKDFEVEPKNSIEDILKDIEGHLPKDFKHPLGQTTPAENIIYSENIIVTPEETNTEEVISEQKVNDTPTEELGNENVESVVWDNVIKNRENKLGE